MKVARVAGIIEAIRVNNQGIHDMTDLDFEGPEIKFTTIKEAVLDEILAVSETIEDLGNEGKINGTVLMSKNLHDMAFNENIVDEITDQARYCIARMRSSGACMVDLAEGDSFVIECCDKFNEMLYVTAVMEREDAPDIKHLLIGTPQMKDALIEIARFEIGEGD